MKHFSKLKSIPHLASLLSVFITTLSTFIGVSTFIRSDTWKEVETVSRYMNNNKSSNLLITFKDQDYPNFNYSGNEYVSNLYPLINDEKKIYFACAMPDENITPFTLSSELKTPFIAICRTKKYENNSIETLATTLFGNNDVSNVTSDRIYITKHTADKLLNKENPSNSDYETLIGASIKCNIQKSGKQIVKTFFIRDVIDKFKYSWVEQFYGKDVVVGMQGVADLSLMDNFRIHLIIANDVYANGHIIRKDRNDLVNYYHYIAEYSVADQGSLTENTILNQNIENSKQISCAFIIVGTLFFLIALASVFYPLILYAKKGISIHCYKWFPLYGAIIFCLISLMCFILNLTIPFVTVSFFSPVGFLTALLFFLYLLIFSIFLSDEKKETKNKNTKSLNSNNE